MDPIPPPTITPPARHHELIGAWLDALTFEADHGRIAPATRRTYGSAMRSWLAWVATLGAEPTGLDAYRFLAERAITSHPATVNTILAALRSCYAWLEVQGRYRDIARGLKPLRVHRDGPLPAFTRSQVVDLIAAAPPAAARHSPVADAGQRCAAARDEAIVRILFATGLRLISLIRMNCRDVDDAGDAGLIIRHQPKGHTAKDAIAMVPSRAAAAWRAYLARRQELALEGEAAWIGLWPRPGSRLNVSSVRRIVTNRADLLGIRHRGEDGALKLPRAYGPHALRRSAAVEVIDRFGLEAGQVLLGHASSEQTRRSYARVHKHRILAAARDFMDLEPRLTNVDKEPLGM